MLHLNTLRINLLKTKSQNVVIFILNAVSVKRESRVSDIIQVNCFTRVSMSLYSSVHKHQALFRPGLLFEFPFSGSSCVALGILP